MVGRDDERATIVGALTRSAALVLVEGEAGIGKSRLVDECLAAPELHDRRVLMAVCPPLPEPFPLGAVVDGLRPFHDQLSGLDLSPLAGALRPLFPEWGDLLPPAPETLPDPRETRHRLFRALTELIDGLGVDVLVVEDGHWADAATLDWLLTLCASGGGRRSIIVTYRPLEVSESLLRLTSRLPREMTQARLTLEPLDVPQTCEFVASMFSTTEVSQTFAAFLHEHTGGIPLAVEQTLQLLRDRRDIFRSETGWRRRIMGELQVPPTVRDSVLERVARLPPGTRAVLEAAAVLEAPADESLIAAVAGMEEPVARDGLEAALACGLMREAGRGAFAFSHVLASRAVRDAVPASKRRLLHRRAGESLREGEHPPVVRLCRHFREAGDVGEWCRYAEAAAELALESGDDHTTVAMLHDLLTTADHTLERRVRLTRKLGEAAKLSAEPLSELGERVRAALERVLADPALPPDERGELRFRLGWLKLHLGEFEHGSADMEAALPDLEHQPTLAAQGMLLLAAPLTGAWPAERHLMWARRAVELFPRVQGPVERLVCLNNHALALLMLGEQEGWRVAGSVPGSAESKPERREIARGHLIVAQNALIWGRYREAAEGLATGGAMVKDLGYHRLTDTVRIGEARLAWHTAEWSGLDGVLEDIATSDSADTVSRHEARLLQGQLELASGARQQAERRLREVLALNAVRGPADPFVFPNASLARIALSDGDPTGALEFTGPLIDMIARKGVWLWATDLVPVHLDALVGAGRLADARALVDSFAAGLARRDLPGPAASLDTGRAIVAQAGGEGWAAALFAEAARAWAALPRPYDELLALERQGQCLLGGDDHERGLAVLSEAQRRLRDLGARWDADRVAHLLRGQGVQVARPWRGGRKGYGERLSPREEEIVDLLALGWTNKKIAESLRLSPRTVERHLSAAMRKAGVSSRTALVIAARPAY
ncbi:helix-turn-helix transcriptional regulator [Streptosporangium sp. NBC_01756]|uniref:helix-turn-helix transcriptional regulator n=1 Tax=Streptosporangium sp. NBC_01756 TaxID=2975950 RepID=UPI002DDBFDED|nr:AAA family ATPase [Streptosporangium sp. NBC_01756]WSC85678.1 AAA family ATPase [Streptosporangium sp. NBC_01756]